MRQREAFLERVWAAELKGPDQLPDIDSDEIIITLHEEEPQNDGDDAQNNFMPLGHLFFLLSGIYITPCFIKQMIFLEPT